MTIKSHQKKSIIPEFKTLEEEAEWFDTHDIADYWETLKPVDIQFVLEKPKEENIVVRLQKPVKDSLEQVARRKGLNVSSLTRMWIMEKLQSANQ